MTVHNTADKLSIDVRHLGLSLYFSIEGVQWVSVEESRINAVQPFVFFYANGSAMLVSAS
jgi:hypothetical protein